MPPPCVIGSIEEKERGKAEWRRSMRENMREKKAD